MLNQLKGRKAAALRCWSLSWPALSGIKELHFNKVQTIQQNLIMNNEWACNLVINICFIIANGKYETGLRFSCD